MATTMMGSNSSKKWSGAFKKSKCDVLGIYINKASNLLLKTQGHSKSTSLTGSFKECGNMKLSFEKKDLFKDQYTAKNSPKNPKLYSTRKSIVDLSSPQAKSVMVSPQRSLYKSHEANPFSLAKVQFMERGRNTVHHKVSPFSLELAHQNSTARDGQAKDDAHELKEFIELEDYCRRSITGVTKADSNDVIMRSSFNSCSKCPQMVMKEKSSQKVSFIKKKAKKAGNTSHLVRTMAITISADNKIHYS